MKRTPIPKTVRFRVLMRDGFTCQYCGITSESAVLHVDHLVPVALGGSNCEDNLITACQGCNQGKAATLLSRASEQVLDMAATAFEREQLARALIREQPFNRSGSPIDAPKYIVEQITSQAQALAVSIAAGHHKLDYIAACIGKSRGYVSRLQAGKRAIPDKLISPLCAATGSNLLAQFRQLQDALNHFESERDPVKRLARELEAA